MIRFEGVTKRFADGTVGVDGLDLEVPEGTTVALVGPSGCGKTTTLRLVNRLEDPSSGRVLVGGEDIARIDPTALRRRIGYVIQHAGLLPHRQVDGNVATVPRLLRWTRERIGRRTAEMVDLVGLEEGLLRRYPHQLSGGQQQRAGVARALAADPPVLLMDEPFAAVDPIVRAHLQQEFLDLKARVRKTIVLVTHDIDEAIKLGDLIAIFREGGRLAQFGRPVDVLADPADDFVARFLGRERTLKRLALMTIGRLEPNADLAVRWDARREAVADVSRRQDSPWLAVVDAEGRFQGWLDARGFVDGECAADLAVTAPDTAIGPEESLRTALDAALSSRSRMVAQMDAGGRFRGCLTLEQIAEAGVWK